MPNLVNISVDRQAHGGEPLKPLWAKKLLVEGAARHRIRRRKIEFAGDAPPHENRKGPIALVSVRPTESDISVDRRLHRLAGRHRWRPTSNGEKDRAEAPLSRSSRRRPTSKRSSSASESTAAAIKASVRPPKSPNVPAIGGARSAIIERTLQTKNFYDDN